MLRARCRHHHSRATGCLRRTVSVDARCIVPELLAGGTTSSSGCVAGIPSKGIMETWALPNQSCSEWRTLLWLPYGVGPYGLWTKESPHLTRWGRKMIHEKWIQRSRVRRKTSNVVVRVVTDDPHQKTLRRDQ